MYIHIPYIRHMRAVKVVKVNSSKLDTSRHVPNSLLFTFTI